MISAPLIEYLKKGIFTILGLMLAVYLFVILLTYTGNDPSWSHISSDMTTVNNTGGAMGAWLSDLLYSFFGFGSWWLLVFLTYESILIWWDNKPAFWVLRLVAYVFLILSASALLSQLITIIKPAAETMMGVKGLAGGIIGTELQLRLATLLTAWGSLLFLVVFVLITMTFAFNIHWTLVYKKLTNMAWLGSGLKNDDDTVTATKRSRMQTGKDLIISKITQKKSDSAQLAVKPSSSQNDDDTSNDKAANQGRFSGVLTEFLAKSGIRESVTATVAANATNTPMLEQQASPQTTKVTIKKKRVDNPPLTNSTTSANASTNNNSNGSVAATNPVTTQRKIEPSFAWNDANIVKDLLANQAASEPHPAEIVPASNAFLNSIHSNKADSSHKAARLVSIQTPPLQSDVDNAADFSANNFAVADSEENVELISSAHLDELADAWLAEHDSLSNIQLDRQSSADSSAPLSTEHVSLKDESYQQGGAQDVNSESESAATLTTPTLSKNKTDNPANTKESITAEVEAEAEPLDVFAAMLSQTSVPENITPVTAAVSTVSSEPTMVSEAKNEASNVSKASNVPIDMTPTNTPPAQPMSAPSAPLRSTAQRSEKFAETTVINADFESSAGAQVAGKNSPSPVLNPTPTIRFAVPEGESSNHIADMVPDDDGVDDDSDTLVMPEIHDDVAFSKKSRSMQTAAYRAQLSPIPPLSILEKPDPNHQPSYTADELEQLSELLEIKLQEFNVKASVVNAIPGPVVTRFEVELAAGVKASKVTGISRDLARSLSMASLRVVEVIPGKPYIGIEVPNKQREMVRLIELLDTDKFKDPKSQISMAMGKDIGGKPIITDLARAPHMLVAGTTGSGKSVLVNAMLLSMLLKYTPDQLRLILIDPKQLELANYNDIPHLLTPVVTDMTEAASSLSWCVAEMERRYFLMSVLKVRKLSDFNKQVRAAEKAGNPMLDPLWRPNDSVSISQAPKMKTLPMIVIVADEFADMIMQVGKPAEELITRLAQKSRAAGIHLVLATQRPSVDVITGLIKANIPVRAALRVNSKVDSRTILDSGGAEDMLGNGDMLFLGPGQIEPDRVHGAYVSDEEVNNVCDAWRERGAPDYIDNMAGNFELTSPSGSSGSPTGEDDDLYNEAVAFIMETRKVSASSIQRKFSIGYNRAARIVDSMEDAGLVSPMGKSGKRELLM